MSFRCITLAIFLMCLGADLNAQSTKSVSVLSDSNNAHKPSSFSKFGLHPSFKKLKVDFAKSLNKMKTSLKDQQFFLMAGMNYSKQNVNAGSFNAPFVYALEQKNVFKAGFMGGFRVEGKYKAKHPYAVDFSLNKYATGVNYKSSKRLAPFIGGFSNFKAEDQLFTFNMTALYKQLIPIKDTSKYKFYLVAGPSVDLRMSGQSLDNQVRNNYSKLFLRAQLGFEFDNNSYYTLFFHYRQGLHSITKAPIKTGMNSFDLGMMIKASDLF